MQNKIILIAALIFLLPLTAEAADTIIGASTYNLEQCIAIALEKHPTLRASAGTIRVNESKVGQAKANYYPQVNLSTSYQRIGPASSYNGSADPYNHYSTSLNLGVTLFDFGKTSTEVEIQDLSVNASRADYDDTADEIVLNVKNAYYNLLQTKRNRDVAIDTMNQFQQHLEQANAFFRIGTKPKFDVTKAEVDYGTARLNVMKAENALRIARITLKNVMGIPDRHDFSIIDNLTFKKSSLKLNEALDMAYSKHPNLRSAIAKREAAQRSIELARKGFYPVLSGSAGYGFSGTEFPIEKGWSAGASLSFPLFNGLSTKYQVDEAKASLEVFKANEDLIRQEICLDVQQSFLNVQDATEQISMAEMTVLQAKENFDLASGRYRAGLGSSIEVADATITLNNARANLNTALYNYKVAQAALEKSIGANP